MTDYGFYTVKELTELSGSDISFEIADAALLNNEEGDEYIDILIKELKRREQQYVTQVQVAH